MANGDAAVQRCPNCLKDVPSSRYEMHCAFCTRNVWRCAQCDEVMARSEREAHEQEVHAEVACECGEVMQKRALKRHKAEACMLKQVACEFCELSLPLAQLMDHQEYCGVRTEHCTRCMSLVKMRDMERHLASGCRIGGVRPQASQPSPTAAAASRGGAMSLLSPELGFAGAAAVQPSLYACPLCGLNCQSFEELQSHTAQHHSRRGGAAAAGAQRAGGAARSDGRRAKKRQQRSGVAGADGGGSGRVGDVGGSPPARRRRRTNADWEAEMQAALAGRHGRRGGQAGAAVAATNGAADDDSDADSSEDDDWRPDERVDGMRRVGRGLADAADTGGDGGDEDDDDDDDAQLQRALAMSRAEGWSHTGAAAAGDGEDAQLQLALAMSASMQTAQPPSTAAAAAVPGAEREEKGKREASARRRPAAGRAEEEGRPRAVLVLDSSEDED